MDGTLYSSKKMKLLMAFDIVFYHIFHPFELYNIYILFLFRKEREKCNHKNGSLEENQYRKIAQLLDLQEADIKNIVKTWILTRPLKYLKVCRYKNIQKLFFVLHQKNIKIAIASEYPIEKKLTSLELFSDINSCSLDPWINVFKPDPKNFLYISEKLNTPPSHIVVIGDRSDKDGTCAQKSGMHFIDISHSPEKIFKKLISFFEKLT
jgi:HAD superfamily hydrolase (TIGR01549 family)